MSAVIDISSASVFKGTTGSKRSLREADREDAFLRDDFIIKGNNIIAIKIRQTLRKERERSLVVLGRC